MQAEATDDENLEAIKKHLGEAATGIRNKYGKDRVLLTTDSKECTAAASELEAERQAARLASQRRQINIEQLEKEIEHLTREKRDLHEHRLQLIDIVVVWAAALTKRKGAGKLRSGSNTKRSRLELAVNMAMKAFPDYAKELKSYVGPVSVTGGMLEAILEEARTDKYHVRYSQPLLSFCMQMTAKSPAAYRMLQRACKTMPTEATLKAYRCVSCQVRWGHCTRT